MDGRLYFTRRGLAKLQQEVKELEKRLRDLQSQSAHVAEIGGNQYHDNSSYEMLVVDLRGIDWLLKDAHHRLNHAMVVGLATNANKIAIGTRVKIMRDGKEFTWEIAGFGKSDPDLGVLAYNTPLASMLMGKSEGELITGIIAGNRTEIEILEITTKGGEDAESE